MPYYVYVMSNRMNVPGSPTISAGGSPTIKQVSLPASRMYHLKRLVSFESYENVSDAIAREKQFKGCEERKRSS
jgi:hypothetical protein